MISEEKAKPRERKGGNVTVDLKREEQVVKIEEQAAPPPPGLCAVLVAIYNLFDVLSTETLSLSLSLAVSLSV